MRPFKRATLQALVDSVDCVATGGDLGALPTLWIDGELDPLAPLAETRAAIERVRGERLEEHVYRGAIHEFLNETNKAEVVADVTAFLDRDLSTTPAAGAA